MATRHYVPMGQFGAESLDAETPKALCLAPGPWWVEILRPLWVPRSQCRIKTPNPQTGPVLYVAEWVLCRAGVSYRDSGPAPEGARVPQPF